ncbi:uncharacterized protein LOC6041352 [Culex quinquefasciatus]|uniref:uncharacterized protein LOC6041352 n=1 Tax=Culex quinquefasciatus TaxID=7176 RepID=UPI0018E35992|nr:uncharacterized protein LOC6041352 [Culex quinquefasciatus]
MFFDLAAPSRAYLTVCEGARNMSSVLAVPRPAGSVVRHSVLLLAWLIFTVTGSDGQPIECHRPPLDVHPKDCCRMPPLLDEALLAGCKQIHGGEDLKRGVAHEKGSCLVECAMNATGTMTNGMLDQERILQLVAASSTGSPALKSITSAACIRCFQKRLQTVQQPRAATFCSSEAAQFLSCVNMETFKTCLQEYWTDSSSCITLRKFIENCPIPT